ncbi:MAG: hypothetical protein GEU98_16410 [Pseudonocardiaceae bacterium]|nr:hypothetical protein [Pseudonocardiaceae bacterium]
MPGVRRTSGESLLDSVAAVEVAGDGVGKIVRPADRLRRPAPGPMLQAEGRPMPRTLEGYLWSGMTTGGVRKAAWALLFPFSLANIAHWMLPPVPPGNRVAAAFGAINRALLRVAALLLTMLFVAQVAVVSVNLFAVQCLAPRSRCLSAIPDWVRETDPARTALGLLPLLLVIAFLQHVANVNWTVHAPRGSEHKPSGPPATLPGDNLVADPDTPALRALHTTAALATVALLTVGGPLRVPDPVEARVVWSGALALLGLTALGTLSLDDPAGARSEGAGRWLRRALGKPTRFVLVGLGVLLALSTVALPDPLGETEPGSNTSVEVIAALLLGTSVLFAVLLIPSALFARPTWAGLPRHLRAWAGGWAAAPVLALAGLLGGGFGAGLAISLRQLIGSAAIGLPDGYHSITLLWGSGAVLGVLIGGVLAGLTALLRWHVQRTGRGIDEVRLLHARAPDDVTTAACAWGRARWERRHLHQMVFAVAVGLSIGLGLVLVMRFGELPSPGWTNPLAMFGVGVLGLLAAGLLRSVYVAATDPQRAPHLRILADLVSFWPRQAHPTVPPCYALKVVPELAARAREHLREPNTRVVLAGDSLGGVLAVVAAARLMRSVPEEDRERIGVVTAGVPLQWAYMRAFPAVVPPSSLATLYGQLGGRWHALCRGTDPFGGAVTTWQRQVVGDKLLGSGYRSDGVIGPLPAATRGANGALMLGGDHWLPDPQPNPVPGRRWSAGVRAHTDYSSDPAWDDAVAMAAGLRPAEPDRADGAEQTQLFGASLKGAPR